MTLWIWVHFVVASILSTGLCQGHKNTPIFLDSKRTGICQRKYIRNDPVHLESLQGCKVIEGSLQLSLVNSKTQENWANYFYPELREITGYLLVFEIHKLTSLKALFPNLAVIRGQELIDNHSLIISMGNDLQEIGLPSLTDIQRGSVWVTDNERLCYMDTIDWKLITNNSIGHGISNNKPINQCPNACSYKCPTSEFDGRHLCWGSGSSNCQKVFKQFCPLCHGAPCTDQGECCSRQCLGGCSVPMSPNHCYVCKNVIFNGTCTEECPPGFYEYLHRRCVTREECLKITAIADASKSSTTAYLHGMLYESHGKKQCVLECPKDTELRLNYKACVPCGEAPCKKNCPGMQVDSAEKARELSGCTRITGVLTIFIQRGTSGFIVKELKQNLNSIEEIDDYLVIKHTYALFSLNFLENLKIIHGKKLQDERYALVVRSNENLVELWDRKIKIGNENARVLFHYNPKLCPNKIWDFVAQSGTIQSKDDKDKIDIGITNGDKVTCNAHLLNFEILETTGNSVLIRYENFRRNMTFPSHLLSYEVQFKEAASYPAKHASKYDNRDSGGDDDWTVLDYSKISDTSVRFKSEPKWETSRLIGNLKYYTWYAIYVKTVVIPGENNFLNSIITGAESDIIYFRTLAGVPSKPQHFKLASGEPNVVYLSWKSPSQPNGELEKFIIWMASVQQDQKQQDQRNYCRQGRSTTSPAPTTPPPSKEASKDKDEMINQIFNSVFISNPEGSNNPSSNDNLRLKRSIRHSLEDFSDYSGETIKDDINILPSTSPRVPWKMMKVKEIRVVPGQRKYSYELKNLTYFTTYKVGIQACRTISEPDNYDTSTCSDLVVETIQTAPSQKADNIDKSSISTNVTLDNRLHLTWNEPKTPNGVILAYLVKVEKINGTKFVECITRKQFQASRNYTFPEKLARGNYSVRIQVVSLAKDSEWTDDVFVVLHGTDDDDMSSLWVIWVLLFLVLLVILFVLTTGSRRRRAYFCIQGKGNKICRKEIGPKIISANPEYMSNVDIPDKWEVSRDKLTLLEDKVLGQGCFGTVFEGILKDFIDGQPEMRCAVKTVSGDTSGEDRVLFLREAALMAKLDCHCHHVVQFFGVVSKTIPTYVIIELMTNGDLKNYLRSRRPGAYDNGGPPPTLKVMEILRMAAEVADGMAYIHKHKLVHRDLAARNCMVGEDMCVKVGDFGMTKEMLLNDYYRKQTRGLLPVRWMAPESLRDGVFTNQSDVWSFGVVLWELATFAALPYPGLGNNHVGEFIVSGGIMERPGNCPDILFELMTWCWQVESRHRPNFVQILERLSPHLDTSFVQVSFFHSPEGLKYQDQLKLQ